TSARALRLERGIICSVPIIFTPAYLKTIPDQPGLSDPESHQVARLPIFSQFRDQLERWAADYPERNRAQVIGHIRAEDHEQHRCAKLKLALCRLLTCFRRRQGATTTSARCGSRSCTCCGRRGCRDRDAVDHGPCFGGHDEPLLDRRYGRKEGSGCRGGPAH